MDPLLLLITGIAVIVAGIMVLKLHPVLALLLAAIVVGMLTGDSNLEQYAQASGMSEAETSDLLGRSLGMRIASAFGGTASRIGVLIAMAAVIGTCLMRSGAADQIIRGVLKLLGEKRAPAAFLSGGFILGIPVYFDTVFYLLVPLSKAMTLLTGKHYLFYLMAIVAGAAMAHSLVPPTPGPLFVAAEMGIDMGVMILGGLVVGLFTVTGGYLYAAWANRKWTIPLRDTGALPTRIPDNLQEKGERRLPPIWLSLLPILLPVFLISGHTISRAIQPEGFWSTLFSFLGDSNIALTLAAFLALGMLAMYRRDRQELKNHMVEALRGAGLIILITSMGGAFGGILQQTGIGPRIQELAVEYQMAILPLAFFITALMKTAQGSATVAMITSVGIVGGLASMGELAFHPVYLALIIGCGSKPIPWMNDSGFWVVCTMSGMTEGETLKTYTTVLSIMGFVGLFVIMVLARLFPLI